MPINRIIFDDKYLNRKRSHGLKNSLKIFIKNNLIFKKNYVSIRIREMKLINSTESASHGLKSEQVDKHILYNCTFFPLVKYT